MPTADLVITGAHVRTLDPRRPYATAVAVRDGLIAAVGETEDVRDWRGPGTEIVDLGGGRLVPGLVDSHSHPVWGLDMATGLDLTAVRDLDGLRAALSSAERTDGWVIGYGLDHNVFGGRPIDRALVEDVLDGAPAFLRLYDGHSALVTEAALKAAGITGPRAFAQRSHLAVDADGRLTGHLVEHAAMELVQPVLPRPSYDERRARLVELLHSMAATGLTGAHVMDLGDLDLVGAVAEETVLPLRLRFAPWCMPGADADDLAELVALQGRGGRHWRVGGVKFFMDGTVEGGTAWLDHPDCHGQGTDAFWPDPAAYSEAVRHLHRAGVRTATHAIGDAAVRHVLDTVESLGPGGRLAHRVEHIESVPDDLVARFAESGVIASMQPPHTAYTWADLTDEWSVRLGEERALRAWRLRDLRDAGAVVALGSDWPIAHYDARAVVATARAPKGAASSRDGLTGVQALEGCTSHAAVAAGEADAAGRIAVGFRADLTALGVDPVEAPADEVGEAPVLLTVTGGHVVYRG
ncbi:amidohydrolase [Streptomyces ipomoeae]|uniref:amidohydrolase n=1 Tax=Streptomyces ipomoeae TaxID=103232 RepID=UPI001146E6E7|nr:amidohydrolase [Streptomyces ipomoeae]MDX2933775.1 amidohydrolase [Streptomyces ipomoeae]TQE25809.1 amidohydrolase [Streptomyces ipomoeae]